MSKASIQTTPAAGKPDVAVATPGGVPRVRATRFRAVKKVLQALASLRLTVVLFVLSLALVFLGTLAQIDSGIWTVVNDYFRSFWVWIPFQLLVQFAQVFLGVPKTAHLSGSFPYPGGWLLGSLLLVNLLAAHLVRFKLSWKRSGILLIHSGLVLMMLGELVTGLFAVEGNMTIDEGSSSNFVEHHRFSELAVIDSSAKDRDDVVVVPGALLRKGGEVRHEALPFDVEVVRYMTNSDLKDLGADDPNEAAPATAGAGLRHKAVEQKEVSGTSQEQTVETPAAYVTLKSKEDGHALGTYLFHIYLKPQQVTVGGKTYDVALRFKRTYKPYSLFLKEFRFDRYLGTNTPRNYSSRVQLVDPERHEDREVLIRMNEPLRHRGETIYQVNFDKRTEKTTVLQVVRNPGWLMPYFSCAVVSLGMLVHFGLHLIGFLGRRAVS